MAAHLQWDPTFSVQRSQGPATPWRKLDEFDMLPPTFSVLPVEDTPVNARAALLSRDAPPLRSQVGKLFVGPCDSALHWAGQHVGYIINCADTSYPWHPFCVRFWLNPGKQGVSWEARMFTAVKLVFAALMFGEGVLLHCRRGKHQSGAFCVLILALLLGNDIDAALDFYFSKREDMHDFRGRVHAGDWNKVRGILDKMGYKRLLNVIRQQIWYEKALANMSSVASRVPPDSNEDEDDSDSDDDHGWVCQDCGKMPWSCYCRPAERTRQLSPFFPFSASTEEPEVVERRFFQGLSHREGVWWQAERDTRDSRVQRFRSRSPTPDPNDRQAWPCPQCSNLNSKHVLFCTVAVCAARRPLVQLWSLGDYTCEQCGNHRFPSSKFCQWLHCHSNDWECPTCKSLNSGACQECEVRARVRRVCDVTATRSQGL